MEGLLAPSQTFLRSGYQVDARLYACAMGLQRNADRRVERRGSRNVEGRGGGFLGTIECVVVRRFILGWTVLPKNLTVTKMWSVFPQEHPWSTLLACTMVKRHVHRI